MIVASVSNYKEKLRASMAFILMLVTLIVGGCATKRDLYYWGSYESLIYSTYKKPGSVPPSEQINILTADIQKAKYLERITPPGVYAHLGYMYALAGSIEASKIAFEEEKKLYPESGKMIEGMLDRAMKAVAKQDKGAAK